MRVEREGSRMRGERKMSLAGRKRKERKEKEGKEEERRYNASV